MERVEIGAAVLYHGDCLEILPTLDKVDAVVTDPPYGIAYMHSGGYNIATCAVYRGSGKQKFAKTPIYGDDKPFDPSHLLQWRCVLFGADHFSSRLPNGGIFHTWDKDPRGKMGHDSFADAEIIWTSFRTKRRVFRYLWKGLCQEGAGDVRHHPSMKPTALMCWCIGLLPENDESILDPYMGSGTTGVACAQLGRKFIGIEIERRYFDIACERIEKAYAQGKLFEEPVKQPEQAALL